MRSFAPERISRRAFSKKWYSKFHKLAEQIYQSGRARDVVNPDVYAMRLELTDWTEKLFDTIVKLGRGCSIIYIIARSLMDARANFTIVSNNFLCNLTIPPSLRTPLGISTIWHLDFYWNVLYRNVNAEVSLFRTFNLNFNSQRKNLSFLRTLIFVCGHRFRYVRTIAPLAWISNPVITNYSELRPRS